MNHQVSILAPVPSAAAFLFLALRHDRDVGDLLDELEAQILPEHLLVALGPQVLAAAGASVPGLHAFPQFGPQHVSIPSTPWDLFVRVAGADAGEVFHRERAFLSSLESVELQERIDGFLHRDSRDLTGYEDGTENPTGDDASRVALCSGEGPDLDGGSILAVQRWVHDMDAFEAMASGRQDDIIGRQRQTNEELEEAPESAHVKRTAQEDFSPEAFVVRRSMPWRDQGGAGLVFVSFSATLAPFEALLRRMVGADDGVVDALFQFTRPVTGGSYWCPPMKGEHLNLKALR